MSTSPKISIIISNYNGMKWLKNCLDSLFNQTYKNFEVILVDNKSQDESVQFVKKNYPQVKVIENKKDLGFAGGNNVGLKYVTGEYVLLLNNDTISEKNYLKNFIKAFDEIPNLGSAQSKIILMSDNNKLDICGAFWTSSSFLYYYGYEKDAYSKMYDKSIPVFSNKGASMLIKKEVIDKVGLFDNDFYMYYEETDLCHRIWLAGYECWYYPNAVVQHAVGGTTITLKNSYIQFHNFKNKLLSFIKNFEIKNLLYIIPIYIVINILLSFMWILQGKFKHFFSLYQALWWNMTNLNNTLQKRNKIQNLRKVTDRDILAKTQKNPRIDYYYYLFTGEIEKYKDKNPW